MPHRLLAALALIIAGAAVAEEAGHADEDHLSELDGVRVMHAWTNASSIDTIRIFLEVENLSGVDVILTGATSEVAAFHDLEGAPLTPDGDPVQLSDGLPVRAGRAIELGPEGAYLRLSGLTIAPRDGDHFDVTLLIEPLGPLDIVVEVLSENATEHPHSDHRH